MEHMIAVDGTRRKVKYKYCVKIVLGGVYGTRRKVKYKYCVKIVLGGVYHLPFEAPFDTEEFVAKVSDTRTMSRAPILIKELVQGNQVWKMHIRVVDLWVVTEKTGYQHLECVLQDGTGDQIHVTISRWDFKDWIEQIKEHETYYLYNGEPVANDGPLKVCSNPLKILFNGGTTLTKVDMPDIPPHKFNFHAIENFLNGHFKPDMLYDVIGVLQDVVKTQMGGGGKKSCTNITLRDVVGNAIEVALWGDFSKQFMDYKTLGKHVGPTIIILTHAWCKPNTVSGLPSLSNAWNGSKLLINLDHPQVETFKTSFGAADLSNASNLSLSLTCDSSIQSTNQNWTSRNEVRIIRDIYEGEKDCFATTIGTTKRFKASRFGWFFESCPGCKISIKSVGGKVECHCGVKDVEPITKFKIEVEVEYDGFNGTFVFRDKDCVPYTKLSAKELRKLMIANGEDNPKIWPAQVDNLLNKEMAFRIKFQSSYKQYSIVTILNEDNVYNKLKGYLTPDEEHTSNAPVLEISNSDPNHEPTEPIVRA
ncbi:uncharacterized protein LOC131649106 [Vicia villosa]|uniref:uncharacterized protein LOC131649106 n=1 Tax=Vicia villosa TaxID=3911 RepID=UPI00273BDAC2|nr:uncharacterized protein LOC131649106 [Vicia villosa]